jgi:hypothetical protein
MATKAQDKVLFQLKRHFGGFLPKHSGACQINGTHRMLAYDTGARAAIVVERVVRRPGKPPLNVFKAWSPVEKAPQK